MNAPISLIINDRIKDRRVDFFTRFNISLRFDSFGSAFSFEAPFNYKNQDHVDMFCIGHYHVVKIEYNGKRFLTGYLIDNGFSSEPTKQLVTFGGYSLAGVLEDCNINTDNYPLQMDGLTLSEIVDRLVKPFNVSYRIDPSVSSEMNSAFDKATAEPTQTIKDFITKLAGQKNIIITNNESGQLVFTRANTNKSPILDFDNSLEQSIPFTKMQLGFNGQGMHSHITVVKQQDEDGGNAGEDTVRNPFVFPSAVFRPKVVTQSSGDDIDTAKAARNILSNELKNLKLTISTDRWEDINGDIIKPGNIVTVKNPEIYLFKKIPWFIEQVIFRGDQAAFTTEIVCSLREVYNGQTPEYIWKGINLH